ncbi:outer membrane protein [Burkholderia pseudomallei Pakistan 9]|nr:outer membrane protein [Burkholderia pseudomallei 576]EEH26728.1 outer membrane protein [Burkholderia pseudomallei Pakistan 9]
MSARSSISLYGLADVYAGTQQSLGKRCRRSRRLLHATRIDA